jgi:hypothetical protein
LSRAIGRTSAIDGGQLGRITMEILRPVPVALLHVEARVVRPGKRAELLEATLGHDGEPLMLARAWMVARDDVPEAAAPADALLGPDAAEPVELPWWKSSEIAYHRGFEWRLVSGTVAKPGPAHIWTRQTVELVAGEPPTPLQRLLTMADAASGVSWQLPWEQYQFPNVDYSLHLQRPPEGEWMAMDAVTRPGASGSGQCTAVLRDISGRVGVSTQTLVISRR